MDINERYRAVASVVEHIFLSPRGSSEAPDVARQSRLLSSLLIVVMLSGLVLTVPDILFPVGMPGENLPDLIISVAAVILLFFTYLLNRSGRYAMSAAASVIVMAAAIFTASYPSPSTGDIGMLYFLAIPILFSGILLPLAFNLQFDLVIVVGMVIFKIILPRVELDQVPIVTVSVIAGFSLLAAVHRDRLESDRRAVLAASELRFRTLLNNAPEAVLLVELPGGKILEANRTAESLLGITRHVLLESGYSCLFASGGDESETMEFTSALQRAVAGTRPSIEWQYFRPGCPPVLLRTQFVKMPSDTGVCVRVSMTDITVTKKLENSLRYLATHDSLTGLANRNLLYDRLSTALATADRENRSVSVLFLDLDDFKQVNETFDHQSGDALLREIAARFKLVLRESDCVARLGGDEFAFLLDGAGHSSDNADTEGVIGRLLNVISKPARFDGHEISVTASIGASRFPEDGRTARMLLQNADIALFNAKARGKNTFCFYTAGMTNETSDRPASGPELREALERGELSPVFQMQVDPGTGAIRAVEALIRWHHPERGLLHPGAFLPSVEEAGLGLAFDEWMMRRACVQLRKWHDEGFTTLKMSVNIGKSSLLSGEMVPCIRRILEETGIGAESLELEIPENFLAVCREPLGNFFSELDGSGIRIVMDDSRADCVVLRDLSRLPIHGLKFGRPFVRESGSIGERELAVLKGIIGITSDIGLTACAVGIETREELEAFSSCGIDRVQGYINGPPVPAREFENLIREYPMRTHPSVRR